MSSVTHIRNEMERDKFAQNKKAIIFYSADYCPACIDIKPLYQRIAKRYGDRISFSILNIEEVGLEFDTVPIFEGYRNGDLVKRMEGVDTVTLKQFIKVMINEKSKK